MSKFEELIYSLLPEAIIGLIGLVVTMFWYVLNNIHKNRTSLEERKVLLDSHERRLTNLENRTLDLQNKQTEMQINIITELSALREAQTKDLSEVKTKLNTVENLLKSIYKDDK